MDSHNPYKQKVYKIGRQGTFYLIAECVFFSTTHDTLSRIDNISGHKTRRNTHKEIETISGIFSDYNSVKLGIKTRRKIRIFTHCWKSSNSLNMQLGLFLTPASLAHLQIEIVKRPMYHPEKVY